MAFYVYTDKLAEERYANVEQLTGNALAEYGIGRCVVVARKVEAWERPYEFVAIARSRVQSTGADSP